MTTGKTVAIILILCAGAGILMIVSCAGLLYLGYTRFENVDAEVSQRIDALFAAIENGTFPATYDTDLTQEFRDATSREQYADLGKSIGTRLGRLKTKSLQGFKVRQFNAASFVDVSYAATFEKGNGTITATLKKQGGKWKFAGFRVESPVFLQDLATDVCPKCGAAHAAGARFCPSCGARIADDKNLDSPAEPTATH